MMYSKDKIDHEIKLLKDEIETGSGFYALYVLKTFKFINDVCKRNKTNWCLERHVPKFAVVKYMYSSVYGGKSDHMGNQIADNTMRTLEGLGYIEFREVDGEKRIYVLKDIDFCDYEDYIYKDSTKYRSEQAYNYLKENGIYIFKYEKECFNCHKTIPIYSYFLGQQLKNEMGKRYEMENFEIPNRHLYDTVGIGTIDKIDNYLANKISSIKKCYSEKMNMEYVANTCEGCGAMQGINYVVYSPTEIEKLPYEELKKKICMKINIDDINLDIKDIRKYL